MDMIIEILNSFRIYILILLLSLNAIYLGRLILEYVWRKRIRKCGYAFDESYHIFLIIICVFYLSIPIWNSNMEQKEKVLYYFIYGISFLLPILASLLFLKYQKILLIDKALSLKLNINYLRVCKAITISIFTVFVILFLGALINELTTGFRITDLMLLFIGVSIFLAPSIEVLYRIYGYINKSIYMQKVIIRNEERLTNLKKSQHLKASSFIEIRAVLIEENGWDDIYIGLENDSFSINVPRRFTVEPFPEFTIHHKIYKMFYGIELRGGHGDKFHPIMKRPITNIKDVLFPGRHITFQEHNPKLRKLYGNENYYAEYYFDYLIGMDFEIIGELDANTFKVKDILNNISRIPYQILTIPNFVFLSVKNNS